MTFKDLRKKVSSNQEIQQQNKLFCRVRSKPFWIWDLEEHKHEDIQTKGDCCFNHIIGLPTKDGLEKPIFDYQKILYDTLLIPDNHNTPSHDFKHKHLWIKKATGLGVTEFFLRLMAWLCLKDDTYRNSQMCIVTGPNQDIAIKLIKRMKGLFEPHNIIFANKETVLELNGCTIEAFPSNHLDAYRALDNPKFILLDEADFLVVMVSTPNAPDGLFESIEKEPEATCICQRLFLDYAYGLDRIYTREEIEKAKQSPSFEREYNLKYLGRIGNVFHTKDIDRAIEKGKQYDPEIVNQYASKSMGIDPAWGSSAFGIVVTQWVDNHIQIIHAEEYLRPDYNEMLNVVWKLLKKFNINKIYIDGANPSFIRSLKVQMDERPDYEFYIERAYKTRRELWEYMDVIPVHFSTEHKDMLAHCKIKLEKELVAINPKFDKLITALRTAVDNEGTLDKKATSYDDIFDSYRLALEYYHHRSE